MTKTEFIQLMHFPGEWLSLGMYPDELFQWQLSSYVPGHELGAEHDRNGAFHWWLRQQPTKEQLRSLLKLAALDPDAGLSNDVRKHLRSVAAFDGELASYDQQLFGR
jgi:hypothetical protein